MAKATATDSVPERDRPVDEIEVTPAMIEAGAVAFLSLGLGIDDADVIAERVYLAMMEASHKASQNHDLGT